MLQPVVRRTWAPEGRTPVLYSWDRHDRLSVLGGLSLAPRTRRVGLYFTIQETNVTSEQVEAFVRAVHRHLRRRLIVVMDRWSVHRKAAKALFGDRRFWIEWLPPYAPDLNPVDKLWGHTKHDDLANYIPEDLLDLELELDCSIERTRQRPNLLRSFFHAATLEI
jgi:transposase